MSKSEVLAPNYPKLDRALRSIGYSFEVAVADILDNYPGLEEADIHACIAYGAEMSRERFIEIPIEH